MREIDYYSIKYVQVTCPKCNKQMDIIRMINWDNFNTYCYPKCSHCGFTTFNTFDNEEQVIAFLKDRYYKTC